MATVNNSVNLFVYSWTYQDDSELGCIIRAFAIDEQNDTVCLVVRKFEPHIYIQLPEEVDWKNDKVQLLSEMLDRKMRSNIRYRIEKGFIDDIDEKYYMPVKVKLVYKRKLYYANKNYDAETDKYVDKLFPYLKYEFKTHVAACLCNSIGKRPIKIKEFGEHTYKVYEAEQSISPYLKYIAKQDLPSCGWIVAKNYKMVADDDKVTNLRKEYSVLHTNVSSGNHIETVVEPKVLSFDIECYSSIAKTFPDATRPDDCIFNIGVTVSKANRKLEQHLFTMGSEQDVQIEDCIIHACGRNETKLLLDFIEFVNEEQPHAITGYNILSFDFKYMLDRCEYLRCKCDFMKIGLLDGQSAKLIEMSWESKAYSAQNFVYMDIPGILQIDLLPIIKKDYKMRDYKLDTVTQEFGLSGKHPLTPNELFECYQQFTSESLSKVGSYCVNDTAITHQLFYRAQTWSSVCEMAKTANVPVMHTFLKGNQIQMYCQVMRHCAQNNIVLQKDGYVSDGTEKFTGAIVLVPIPGLYKNILSFDFASLYPSIIMAHNIDFSTLVTQQHDIPAKYCHDIHWEETDDKTGVVSKYHFKFLKEEYSQKGVIPTMIMKHINARKETRKRLRESEKELELIKSSNLPDKYKDLTESQISDTIKQYELLCVVLEKRQLAFKICANCFPSVDHEIMTEFGFFKLEQILSHFQKHELLKIGCDVDGELQYHSITIDQVIQQTGTFDMIQFENQAKNISICATENHRMWACLDSNKFETYNAGTLFEKGQLFKSTTAEFRCFDSKELLFDAKASNTSNASNTIDLSNDCLKYVYTGTVWCVSVPTESQLIYARRQYLIKNENKHSKATLVKNSQYGAMGATKGYLPFLPGAQTTTAIGRRSIMFVADFIKNNYGGLIVYGDTDSCHVHFDESIVKNKTDAEKYATIVTDDINNRPEIIKPMKLEFEKLYNEYLIFTKKRYIAVERDDNGEVISKIEKGVLSKRRDNCLLAKKMFQFCVETIMTDGGLEVVQNFLINCIMGMFTMQHKVHDYIITKMLNKDYKSEPAHKKLSETMKARGNAVEAGSRMEYLFVDYCQGEKKVKQSFKVEDLEYFKHWKRYIHLDYLYYLERFIKAIDEVLLVGLKHSDFVKTLYKYHLQKFEVVQRIKYLSSVKFTTNSICKNEDKLIIPVKAKKKKLKNFILSPENDDDQIEFVS